MAKRNLPVPTPFKNGMTLWSLRNELLSASQIGFIRGCRYDLPKAIGMAHFGEHVWCHGVNNSTLRIMEHRHPTRPRPISERLANRTYRKFMGGSNGPGINVYTVQSHIGFGHQDLFHPKYLKTVFPVMAGLVRDGMFDARDLRVRSHSVVSRRVFDVERSAILHETAENDEWPAMLGYRAALKELYATNPARNFGDSEPEHLKEMRPGQLNLWLHNNLGPQVLNVIIIGPTRDEAVKHVREAGLNQVPETRLVPWWYDRSDDVPKLAEVKRLERQGTGKMTHVCMLWPTETYGGPAMYPIQVLVGIMKDRMEGLLREEMLAVYHPAVEWEASSSHGLIEVTFSTLRGVSCDGLISRVLDLFDELKADRSDEFAEDVQDGRFYLAHSYREDYQYTPGAFADRMMKALANGDSNLDRFNNYFSDMLHVTPERVRNAAKKYLSREAFVLSIVRPVD